MMGPRGRLVGRVTGYVVGAALTAAAVAMAIRSTPWETLRHADPGWLSLLALTVAVNLALAGAMFWCVTLSFDARPRVGLAKMTALMAISAMLNYLPMRPGLMGRAAYLKVKHGLPLRQSVWILGVVLATATLVLVTTGLAAALGPRGGEGGSCLAAVAFLSCLSTLTGRAARRVLRRPVTAAWGWIAIRLADMLVAGLRTSVALHLVGVEVSYGQAVAAGAAGMLVSLIGLTPNGLGMREWAIAATAAALAPVSTSAGLAASLLDRAVEVVVVCLAGLISLAWLGMPRTSPANSEGNSA
ncbi:MAG: flippase-like domain-containing protein [Phycisphaeraceae bacterium]|nr:flippase-like domain-containing protein [Phycisphaeraceae bacterium]